MLSLLKIKGMLDQLSANERKLADFILDNSHLLRDYSSQQLADAVGISQSSVVKFCQKLGYKGYPDLKLAITEAVVTASTLQREHADAISERGSVGQLADLLQQSLLDNLRSLLSVNTEQNIKQAALLLEQAPQILITGSGMSAMVALEMQHRLLAIGKLALYQAEAAATLQLVSMLKPNAVMLLLADNGQQADTLRLEHYAKQHNIKVIMITGYQTNTQSAAADLTLFTLGSDVAPNLLPIIVSQAQQHLCHLLYLLLSLPK